MHDDLTGLLRAIRTFGMPGAESGVVVSPSPSVWESARHHLRRERLSGLAAAAATAGVLELDGGQLAALAALDRTVQARTVRAEQLTIELVGDLAAATVPVRVLKGPVTARWAYPEPSWRPFIDVDLLVPPEHLDPTVRHLEQLGATRALPELRPGHDRRFGKSVTLRHQRDLEVDLHRTLTVGPLCHVVPVADLWHDQEEVELVPGQRVPALDRDLAFLHACLHLAVGGPAGPLPARDVVGLAAGADLTRCAGLASGWRATAAVRHAVTEAERVVPVPTDLSQWAGELTPTMAERRILAAYLGASTPGRLALASWRHVPGLAAKVAYGRALALPSRANRSARHRSVLGHAGRVLRLGRRGSS